MSKRRGFTLIELLVVIAIIALLMAILMPALQRVKGQAQSVSCQARLKQWGLMFMMYTDDYDGYFNEGWGYDHHHPGQGGEPGLWPNALRPYYKDNWGMLLCPTATRVVLNDADMRTYKASQRDINLPGGGSYLYTFSYGINSWTNYMIKARGDRPAEWFWKRADETSCVLPNGTPSGKKVSANYVPVFADSTWHDAWPRHTDGPLEYPDGFGVEGSGTSAEMNHFSIDRHNGFINFLFMDWSVRPVGLKELWTLKWHRAYVTNGPYTMAGGVRPEDWPVWMRKYRDY